MLQYFTGRWQVTGADQGKVLTTGQLVQLTELSIFYLRPKLEERKNTRPKNLTTAPAALAVVWIFPCLMSCLIIA